jgi:hypothetical protein
MNEADKAQPWGPHDLGGQEAGAVDLSEHDTAHWEWQIDAMLRLAMQRGLLADFAELRDGIEQLDADDYANCSYYERWAKSLARALLSKGVISEQALTHKVDEIRARQQASQDQ